jgi:uncharacterized membrane protein YdcZ (DUF606 family)
MFDRLTRREVAGMPVGFVLALISSLLGVAAAWNVALSLDTIRSFAEIARPAFLAVTLGVLAAVVAVVTTHRIDRDD